MPLSTIGYDITLLGKPLVIWLGILTFTLVFLQVFIAFTNLRMNKSWIPFEVHRKLGYVVLLVAAIHAIIVGLYWWF